jgi:hypothetical protein
MLEAGHRTEELPKGLRATLALLVARLEEWTRTYPDPLYLNHLTWWRVLALQGPPLLLIETDEECGQADGRHNHAQGEARPNSQA